MRPGYGLVTEECPSHAVGCRIRAKKDHIDWYEFSRLYDRNQLVCVYPEEYASMTGCARKTSGNIRCWCGGRDNCNDPETSRDLYEAFTEGNTDAIEKISDWLRSEKSASSWKKFTTTEEPPSTTTTTTTTEATTSTSTKSPTTKKPKTTTTRKPKRIGIAKTTTVAPEKTTKINRKVNVVNIINKGDVVVSNELSTYEETRRKLEKDMKEEEERMKEMLADEEEEDIDDISSDLTEDEIAQQSESRRLDENLAEDVILRRMEEDEELRQSRQTDEYSDVFMSGNSASNIFNIFIVALIIFKCTF
ncbi:unnamed protein product [Caenorhabditis angaria]|uniref:Uncharacterized protein n=1 Tax=Caenorhabditis angaria TaxID=860376 RepID=A0A9P1MU40_9PELO|nr:unnamed protein product [Caenorhabditis angaria]